MVIVIKNLIWICDDPRCPYKGYEEDDADNHCISKNHTVTKCKILSEQVNRSVNEK